MLGRQNQNDLFYIYLSFSRYTLALASFLILEPLNPLPSPSLGTCSLLLPQILPERPAHSHPLALSSNDPFSKASLAAHPSRLPNYFLLHPSPCFSLLDTYRSL